MNKTKTTSITYLYDDDTGRKIGQTVTETTSEPTVTTDDDYEVETGVALDSVIETSPWETLLTAAAGAFLGNVIYRIVKGLTDR